MSELSQLIQINKNIEKQNEEIIRLLKIIANEAEDEEIEESIEEELNEEYLDENTLFRYGVNKSIEGEMAAGEVYFIEDKNMFKLSVDENNITIDNLTGSAKPNSFALEKLIANESMKNNVSLEDGTVIISLDNSNNLAESLKICVEQSAKKVFIPVSASTQLIGAPQQIMQLVKLDVYKNEENLIEKLFNK
ncbi:hypothetical protein [Methanobrevibacter sp.]|uniref:hypothetical protein n=1 Tax=Methanobrevibacter sp. TaxID=66852 RepID=UPI002A75A0E5|nr:hypothetical protein [Methanobrevibacter sp.]MDY3096608.1 hypothetical protein [Methanobrevibacter sp.]